MDKKELLIKGLSAYISAILSLLLIIPFDVLFAYIMGLILKVCCGVMLTNGLNIIFSTTRFVPEQIPTMSVTLGIIFTISRFMKNHY